MLKRRTYGLKHWVLAASAALSIVSLPVAAGQSEWPMFGQNIANTATAPNEQDISKHDVSKLKPRWVATLGGDISARAAVVNGVAYVPDWAGNVWAINSKNGKILWSHSLSYYGLAAGTVSRTTPAVANGLVYLGTQYNPSGPTGWLLALNAQTGEKVWMVQPDTSNGFPVITASPTVVSGRVFVGMTSNEEFAAASSSYPCCSARGSVVALDASTGALLWQTFTVPKGYSGGNVWGSNPVVDVSRGTVYVGTGNNYSIPTYPAYTSCIGGGGTASSCLSPDDHADSIVALDMKTGAIKWAARLMNWNQPQYGITDGSDFWNYGCIYGSTTCPSTDIGPNYDFGSGPNEITYAGSKGPATFIGAGQKSGIYYALDPDTGAELWHTQVGPGSSLGGMEWGSASDGQRIYVAIADFYGIPYAAGSAGSWAALDPATGKILWQVKDPSGATDLGPVTVVNGVVYVPSMAGAPGNPTMLALDASTGATLWSYAAGSSVIAGATVAEGGVLWGSGYSHLGSFLPFTGNNKLFSFTVGGH
jgi:polyvinyl alcohol dehydrogenase (cytochrome)